jgi:hypothetical protein
MATKKKKPIKKDPPLKFNLTFEEAIKKSITTKIKKGASKK